MHCESAPLTDKEGTPVPNTLNYSSMVTLKKYLYGEGFIVTCKLGYVSVINNSTNMVKIWCGY